MMLEVHHLVYMHTMPLTDIHYQPIIMTKMHTQRIVHLFMKIILGGMVDVGMVIILDLVNRIMYIGRVLQVTNMPMELYFYHLQIYNIMETRLKEMKLKIIKLNDTQYKRIIEDFDGNEIWNGGEQYYIYDGVVVMQNQNLLELIEQMKGLPFWNIVEVINELYPTE
jgi:hypothetical protein